MELFKSQNRIIIRDGLYDAIKVKTSVCAK